MFAKPYKLKSNNTLKNSEKKHLAQRIQNEFPAATEEKVKELVPVKSNSSCMKLILHSGDTVGVYVVDGVPVMIDLGESLVPTVCALWKIPELVPIISVHSPVLSKVLGGAPLYVPGVVTDPGFPRFHRKSVVAACTTDNAAAGMVGHAVMSSGDILGASMGVCLEILHVFGDLLCKDPKFTKIERPKLGPASYSDITNDITADLNQLNIKPVKEEWPSLVKEDPSVVNEPKVIAEEPSSAPAQPAREDDVDLDETVETECSEAEEDEIPSDMDGLLRWCLLSFLKLDGKSIELPLKTNLLYKNYLMPLCPPDRTLEVKKSTYKKMGKFLEAMQREGLVQVREIDKGVDALVALQVAHPLVRAHRVPAAARRRHPREGGGAEYVPPQIRELYCITANVVDLFVPLKKGTALQASEVRSTLQEYVRVRSLTARNARGAVSLDVTLAKVAGRQPGDVIKWEELTTGVLSRMTPATETRFADGTVKLCKTKLEPVKMQVATRSGNKKVTLVSNLESFGFHLPSLAHTCQLGVAASCGVTRSAAARADQLMLQGDQTHFVAKLLIEKYGLPKKFVEGADKALNKKK